jgi:hypothetical protein
MNTGVSAIIKAKASTSQRKSGIRTIETFRGNCTDPHGVDVLGVVYTQVTNASGAEKQAIAEIDQAVQKEKTYRFASSLGYSRSFIRSVKDQTPIFATAFAQKQTKLAVSKIADELKKRIVVLAANPKKVKK